MNKCIFEVCSYREDIQNDSLRAKWIFKMNRAFVICVFSLLVNPKLNQFSEIIQTKKSAAHK